VQSTPHSLPHMYVYISNFVQTVHQKICFGRSLINRKYEGHSIACQCAKTELIYVYVCISLPILDFRGRSEWVVNATPWPP